MKELRYKNQLSFTNKFLRMLWGIVYYLLFKPTPSWILFGWRSNLLRFFGAQIGQGCRVDSSVQIWAPWNLVMGDFVAIGENVDLYSVDKIIIGSKVTISQRAFLCTASHDVRSLHRPLTHAPINLENHVWIAAEAMLHPGVFVKEGAVVAARAVVRNEVAPWSIWAGNPARKVSERKLDVDVPFQELSEN